ncbi:MAG: calcium-binding protein [Desulfobulbus sp.]
MIANDKLAIMTELAEASYAELQDAVEDQDKFGSRLLRTLDNKDDLLSLPQATEIAAEWAVAAHQPDTASDFSATLFRSLDGEGYVLSCRGTAGGGDIAADLGDIVRDGLALDQIIDLYNFWQRIQADKGQPYSAVKLETLTMETGLYQAAVQFVKNDNSDMVLPGTNLSAALFIEELRSRTDVVIDEPSGTVRTVVPISSDLLYIADDPRQKGLDIDVSQVTVVGHSLGGHLAAAFSRLFPSVTEDVLMINGAGFGTAGAISTSGNGPSNVDHLFTMLGGERSFATDKITNLIGSAGFDFVAQDWWIGLQQPGNVQEIETESWFSTETTLGHGSGQMTDSMAVYNLFLTMDHSLAAHSLSEVMGILTPVFQRSSSTAESMFESITCKLYKLFKGSDLTLETNNRADLHNAIQEIQSTLTGITNLQVKSLVPITTDELAQLAQGDVAYRYALLELNPFAVVNADYSQLNQNGELDRSTHSDQYIEDRAKFLYYLTHPDATVSNFDPDIDFVDNRLGISIEIDNGMMSFQDDSQYLFGNLEGELLEGEDEIDHLYGMGGNDILKGYGGADYLEGGLGQDTMIGGSGDDTFYVQGQDTDYDKFIGGEDTDTILGGAGDDTIRVHELLASDSIEVIDGGGGNNTVSGTAISDTIDLSATQLIKIAEIHGEGGGDTITGTSENDNIFGDDGEDILIGGSGDDTLTGGAGVDTYIINTGDGNDTIIDEGYNILKVNGIFIAGVFTQIAGTSSYLLNINNQDLTLNFGTSTTLTIDGTTSLAFANQTSVADFADHAFGITLSEEQSTERTLIGDDDNDIVFGTYDSTTWYFGFSGTISGTGVTDYFLYDWKMFGYTAADASPPTLQIDGNGGNDHLAGLAGADIITGGDGNDVLVGDADLTLVGSGTYPDEPSWTGTGSGDQLWGDAGRDALFGAQGDDILFGGEDNDYLSGDAGNDILDGGNNDDLLAGGDGDDQLIGGLGNDVLYGDVTVVSDVAWSNIDMSTWSMTVGYDSDGWISSLTMEGFGLGQASAPGNDLLVGGGGNDLLVGESGSDILLGEEGIDRLEGGEGDDYLDGGTDDDLLLGEAGSDQLRGDAGNDILHGDSLNTPLTEQGDDWLDGGDGNDILLGYGGNDELYGGVGDDELQGNEGDDDLYGGDGNDLLFGDNGDHSGDGQDKLYGGSGEDQLTGDGGNDLLDGGDDADLLLGGDGDDILYGGAGDDWLSGENETDTTAVSTLSGNDTLFGGDGDDILIGGNGDDVLSGDTGNDYLYGGSGNDTLNGGDGNDFLWGGTGDDILAGGDGDDTYYISRGSGIKHIVDTTSDHNKIVFQGGINLSSISLSLGSLMISSGEPGDELHIDGVDYDNLADTTPIETIEFSDGQIMRVAERDNSGAKNGIMEKMAILTRSI